MNKKIIGITVGTPIKPELLGGGSNADLSGYVKNTDIATDNTVGVVKTSIQYGIRTLNDTGVLGGVSRTQEQYETLSNYHIISKGTLENLNYVKNTDYATTSKAGLVKLSAYYGVMPSNSNELRGVPIPANEYAKKVNELFISKGTLENIKNNYVKEGLTTNTETLTEEEKAAACDWLGVKALAIPNTISGGGKSLTVNDVLPLAHKCSCKLVSDTYELGGGNNIYETPKNLILVSQYGDMPNFTTLVNDDGSIYLNGYTEETGHLTIDLSNCVSAGQTYTWSLRDENGENPLGYFIFGVQDENYEFTVFEEIHDAVSYTFTVPEGDYRVFISYDDASRFAEFGHEPFDLTVYPQLELGDTMTAWAPYGNQAQIKPYITDFSTVKVNVNGKAYTPSADGTVTGIESVSPSMQITTDNEYANIEDFTYCVDTKAYIDNKIAEMLASIQGV